jgi:EAL domain-containing protein (putative c-di-GMP-specific phosphodiesterase class I)
MLRHAADADHQGAAAGFKLGHVVVNLSPTQFADQSLANNLIELRNQTELP